MKMYIANCTAQVHDFIYRVVESPALRTQKIEIYGQIVVSGNLTDKDVDFIVEQHARYGLIPVSEIDRTRPFIGMCYQVDKPIEVAKIRRAIEHNRDVLQERGVELRKEAAIAVNNKLEEQLTDGRGNPIGTALTALEMSVVEENPGQLETHKPIAEGVRVSRTETPGPSRGRRRR